MTSESDIIVARASAPAAGAVGVVRLSGFNLSAIINELIKRTLPARQAGLVCVYDKDNQVIDQAIGLFFPAPHSYTGEDVFEIQCHGGLVIIDMIINRCLSLGARLAQPGEFTQRAFLNDKMDLCQAEAVSDLIMARTEQAVRSAQRSLKGDFSEKVQNIVSAVTHLRMYVEAAIDFVEEEIDFLGDNQVKQGLSDLIVSLSELLESAKRGVLLNEGCQVVIAGKPNVGKSSLFNLLAQQESAIVTDIPGTTRDVLKESVQINGVPIYLLDTAGIRDAVDLVEQKGIERAQQQMALADKILWLVDATSNPLLSQAEVQCFEPYQEKVLVVINKMDLVQDYPHCPMPTVAISIKEKTGLSDLYGAITKEAQVQVGEGAFIARRRHVNAIEQALRYVEKAQFSLIQLQAGELVAEELKYAQQALGEITGKVTADDLLGKIFSTFCIGK